MWILIGIVVAGVALRLFALGSQRLIYDEAFTAVAARRPIGDLFTFLRHHDSHPPLDYLLTAPFARAGAPEWLLRLPSALAGSAALILFAWWLRRRQRFGVIATAVLAFSSFPILYSRQDRMYGPLLLLGVVMLVLAEHWRRRPSRKVALAVGAAVLIASGFHVTGLVFGLCWIGAAGVRRDEDAWWWRGAILGAVAIWLVVWGPSLVDQLHANQASWIPYTSPHVISRELGELVSFAYDLAWPIAIALIAGAVVLWRRERELAILAGWGFVLPMLVCAGLGLHSHFFLARTLTLGSWAAALFLAVLVEWALTYATRAGAMAAAIVAVTVAVGLHPAVFPSSPIGEGVARAVGAARAGDVVAVYPTAERVFVDWYATGASGFATTPATVTGVPIYGVELGRGAPSGRIWVASTATEPLSVPGNARQCSRPVHAGGAIYQCLRPPAGIVTHLTGGTRR